jgi:hypothetical protein
MDKEIKGIIKMKIVDKNVRVCALAEEVCHWKGARIV